MSAYSTPSPSVLRVVFEAFFLVYPNSSSSVGSMRPPASLHLESLISCAQLQPPLRPARTSDAVPLNPFDLQLCEHNRPVHSSTFVISPVSVFVTRVNFMSRHISFKRSQFKTGITRARSGPVLTDDTCSV